MVCSEGTLSTFYHKILASNSTISHIEYSTAGGKNQ